jgi:hypothetical protein
MTCENMAISACVVTASPYRTTAVGPVVLAWPPVMIPLGVRDDAPSWRNAALQDEAGAVGALDGLVDLRVGGVDQLAHLAADGLLAAGKGIDTDVDAGRWCPAIAPPLRASTVRDKPVARLSRRESMAHGSGNTPTPPTPRRVIRQPLRCGDEFAGRGAEPREPDGGAHNLRICAFSSKGLE